MEEIVKENYYRVKADVAELVRREIARIEADPDLAKLLPKKKTVIFASVRTGADWSGHGHRFGKHASIFAA